MRPTRILYSIPNFVTAGSGQAMVNIIDRLDRRRFEPTVVVNRLGGQLVDHLEATGVRVMLADVTVAERPLATLPWRVWRARRPFIGQFDLWHSFNWAGDYTEPMIAYASGARSWMYTKKNMGWTRAWALRSLLARRIAVQNDQMTERFLNRWYLRYKVRYLPTGIDVEPWQVAAPDTQLRPRLGIASDAVVIVCAGDIQPRKNQLALVQALASVPRAHVVLAGRDLDRDYRAQIDAAASELGVEDRLHLIGSVSDVPGLLKVADVFSLVSFAEGSPIAMVEAMAIGLPGVYAAIPGIEERVTHGHDGFLTDPSDTAGIGRHLATLAASTELRHAMGANAKETAELRGRVETEAARYETLYLELAHRHARFR